MRDREIEDLDAEAKRLEQAEAGTAEKGEEQAIEALRLGEDAHQDHRQPSVAASPDQALELPELAVEDMAIEKHQGAERLGLSMERDPAVAVIVQIGAPLFRSILTSSSPGCRRTSASTSTRGRGQATAAGRTPHRNIGRRQVRRTGARPADRGGLRRSPSGAPSEPARRMIEESPQLPPGSPAVPPRYDEVFFAGRLLVGSPDPAPGGSPSKGP